MQSRQKLLYLPEAHTDFIFAVLAEELGLWGALLTVAGFLIILWRGLRTYFRTPDDFGKYLALGVTTMIVVQAFMNISVVLGMTPTKGIPLPLVSYGGSSLLSTLISLGTSAERGRTFGMKAALVVPDGGRRHRGTCDPGAGGGARVAPARASTVLHRHPPRDRGPAGAGREGFRSNGSRSEG